MEPEIHSQSLSNLRSYNPKNFKSDPQLKVLFDSRQKRDSQQQKNIQCMFDLQTLESQLNRILQPNSALRIQKRATSVENSGKYLKLQKIVDLKKFEMKRKITTPLKSRVELKPLMLSKSRDQSKLRGVGSLVISSQRDLPSELESNPHLAHSRLTSYRSLPPSNYSSAVPSPKDTTLEFHKVLDSEREKQDTANMISSVNKLLDSDHEKRGLPSVILPKIKKEFVPHELVFAPNINPDIVKPHVFRIAQGIFYATQRVKPLSISQLKSKQVELKPQEEKNRKTLVLDLDETLIFARRREAPNEKVGLENNEPEQQSPMRVKIRPYAMEFLKQMSQIFEIVIFTAAEKSYAEVMAKLLDPDQKCISHILHREHCLKTLKGLFLKDLRIIKNRDLKDIIIVDNFTPSFSFQIDNGIPIITWQGDPNDKELKYLMNYLVEANQYDDVRVYNREKLKLKELLELSPEKLTELQT